MKERFRHDAVVCVVMLLLSLLSTFSSTGRVVPCVDATDFIVSPGNYTSAISSIFEAWRDTADDITVKLINDAGAYTINTPLLTLTSGETITLPASDAKTFTIQSDERYLNLFTRAPAISLTGGVPFISVSSSQRANYVLTNLNFTTNSPTGSIIQFDNPQASVTMKYIKVDGGVTLSGSAPLVNVESKFFTGMYIFISTVDAGSVRLMQVSVSETAEIGTLWVTGVDADDLNGGIIDITGDVNLTDSLFSGNTVLDGSVLSVTEGVITGVRIFGNSAPTTLWVQPAVVSTAELTLANCSLFSNTNTTGIRTSSHNTRVVLTRSTSMFWNIPEDINCDPDVAGIFFGPTNICNVSKCPYNIFGFSNFDKCFTCNPARFDDCIGCDGEPFGPEFCEVEGSSTVYTTVRNDPIGRLQHKSGGSVKGSIATAQIIGIRERMKNGTQALYYDLSHFSYNITRSNEEISGVNVTRVEMKSDLRGLAGNPKLTITQDFPTEALTYKIVDGIEVRVERDHLKFTFEIIGWSFRSFLNYLELVYRIDAGSPIRRTVTETQRYTVDGKDYETDLLTFYTDDTVVRSSVQRFAVMNSYALFEVPTTVEEVDEQTRDYILRIDAPFGFYSVSYDPDMGVTLQASDSDEDETLTIVLAVVIPVAVLTVCLVVAVILVVMVVLRYMIKPANIEDTVNL